MDVAAYIKELLNQDKHVFVPGLGTFLIRKDAVSYHQQEFSPPKNSLDFVAGERDDHVLENYISIQKNISVQAAGYFIEKFVDQLKKEIDTKNIPVKEALFLADQHAGASFNQENFGLPPVQLSALNKEPLTDEKQPVKEAPVFEPSSVATEETPVQKDYVENFYREFSSSLPREEPKPKANSSFWVAILLLLAVCCLGVYALYLYYPNLFKGLSPKKQTTTVIVTPPAADTAKQVLARPEKAITKDTTAQITADTIPVKAKIPVPVPQKTATDTSKTADADMVAKSPYEIIGASFRTLKGAKTFLAQLQSKGMRHAKILSNTGGKPVLITFGSYPDKAAALAGLEKLRAKDVHTEAYIQHYLK